MSKVIIMILSILSILSFAIGDICNQFKIVAKDEANNPIIAESNKVIATINIKANNLKLQILPKKTYTQYGHKIILTATLINTNNKQVCNLKLYEKSESMTSKVIGLPVCIGPNEKKIFHIQLKPTTIKRHFRYEAIVYGDIYDSIVITSNWDYANIYMKDDVFNKSGIVGIVYQDVNQNCRYDEKVDVRLPGVRVYLSDGRYIDTDQNGRYHFLYMVKNNVYSIETSIKQHPKCWRNDFRLQYGELKIINIPVILNKDVQNLSFKMQVKLYDFMYNISTNRYLVKKKITITTDLPFTEIKLPKYYLEEIQCNKPIARRDNKLVFMKIGKYICYIVNDGMCLPFEITSKYVKFQDNLCVSKDYVKLSVHFPFGEYILPKDEEKRLIDILNDIARLIQGKQVMIFIYGHTDLRPVRKDNTRYKDNWELSKLRAKYIKSLIDRSLLNIERVKIIRN